ncbi:MurR/RpiR family transcriptional regulator [Pelovirga terrestris]|uniref:MurR/RpiR family transcriptional regulator n=1 Tax=Pelovirga terrestris TaxID=2771352 RepID=A0A8J6UGE8_9BACT|nr:MurR/RpiR family transcriptional regulator [Pelovirga terrestris]MBD1399628.1 MurR/RpiR family transcriptional regulator [Pelovirga terrestris]
MESKSLLERIRDVEKLTPSEAKIAEYLEQKYPQLAYETITTISSGAGVGNATVGRFVLRLGYKNFADFISLLRNELAQNFESPMVRYFGRRESLSESKHGN